MGALELHLLSFKVYLYRLLRANKPESLLSTCSSATASAGDKGDTIDSSRIADQTVESLDALSKPWPQPHSYFSVSDVSYPEGTDIVAELRGLINLLQPLDLSLLHEAVKATGIAMLSLLQHLSN